MSVAARRGGARWQASDTAMMLALAAGTLPVALLQSLVSPALGELQARFATDLGGATWILTSYLLSLAVSTPIVGKLGDIYGKRRVLLIVMVLVILGTVVAVAASSLAVMLVARVIQGVGGGIFPLSYALVRERLPADAVPRAIGQLSATLGVGAGLGIAVSGAIVERLGHRFLFWIPLAMLVPALVSIALFVAESRARRRRRVNWVSAAALSAALTVTLLGISRAPALGWSSPPVLALLGAGAALLGSWALLERRSATPFVDLALLRRRAVWSASVVAAALNVGLFSAFVLLPLFAIGSERHGFGLGAGVVGAGLLLVPISALMLVTPPVAGDLQERFGARAELATGCAAASAAYALMLVAHDGPLPMAIAACLLGLGIGLAYGTATAVVAAAVPASETGVAMGLITMARTVAAALAAQVAGTMVAASTAAGEPRISGFLYGFALAGAVLAGGAFVALAAVPRPTA